MDTGSVSPSHSTTSSTASSCDTEFTKEDEQRLKDYIQQLRNERAAVKLTMLELESVHIDPLSCDVKPRGDSQRLDLENAVLMQELMAMKVGGAGVREAARGGAPTRTQESRVQAGVASCVGILGVDCPRGGPQSRPLRHRVHLP